MSKALALSAVLLLCLGAAFVEAAQEGRATELNKAGDNCTLPGGSLGWECLNTHCIPLEKRCNGVNDCKDNSDEKNCPAGSSGWQGYAGAAVASLFFGTNFIPVKTFDTGDGIFFQFVLCAAIFCTGLVVQLIVGSTPFQPWAVLGGVSWATGNLTVVPAIHTIGLAQGMLIWGTVNMISGWSAGRFGLFGIVPEVPNHPLLQDLGVMCAALSVVAFALVKPSTSERSEDHEGQEKEALLQYVADDAAASVNAGSSPSSDTRQLDTMGWVNRMGSLQKRIFGVSMAMIGGLCYSFAFDPAQYIMDNYTGASQNALHYVFSQFSGIFMASTFWFLVYCAACRNRPNIYPRVVLPAFVSGVMWAIAQVAWFIANQHLSQAVSYPIITTCPGVVATLCGVIFFKEIKGGRNFAAMAVAFTITGAGVALTVMSNQ